MTTFLLDVNVLIARLDPAHVQHDAAHECFGAYGHKAWATCPLTENGVLALLATLATPTPGHAVRRAVADGDAARPTPAMCSGPTTSG